MKELERVKSVYLKEYEVNVTPYLEMAQIAAIIDGVCSVGNTDYLSRKMNEDMLILLHATDIGQEGLEALKYEDCVTSGLIHMVRSRIKNIGLIKEGIDYNESFMRSFALLAPKIIPIVEKVGDLYGKSQQQNRDKK